MPTICRDIEPHHMYPDVSLTHTHTLEDTKIVGLRIGLRSGFLSGESVKPYLSFIGHNREHTYGVLFTDAKRKAKALNGL